MPALFIETIRLDNGVPQNLSFHLERMRHTAGLCGFTLPDIHELAQMCPGYLRAGTVKCRLIYRDSIESITFESYRPRTIRSLAVARIPENFSYQLKYLKREVLDMLRLRSGADEVILVDSEGYVTDSSYSNLLFCREDGVWETPEKPLLKGTMRASLLAHSNAEKTFYSREGTFPGDNKGIVQATTPFGKIELRKIRAKELISYREIALINAMMPPEEAIILPLSSLLPITL